MKQLVKLCQWFIREERGNALLLTSATALMATLGMFFFTALRDMSVKNKERTAHLYNASIMAMSIDTYIQTYLETLPYPKNNLLHNGQAQFTQSELESIVNIHHFDILSLDDLEKNGYIVSHSDPTALRELGEERSYDKSATKIKITFKYTDENTIEDVVYLVNLAGSVYESNAPYSSNEPFFYLVSFNDDFGSGDYGDYDLIDNSLTLVEANGQSLESVLEVNGKAPYSERVIVLPGDIDP
jgi:hypothetical protein